MSNVTDIATSALLLLGGFFFFAGTVGLLRFPDVHSRLHALSKADNLGLGLISAGLMLQAESIAAALKILLIWLLALLTSALSCFAIAEWENERGRERRRI